MFESALDQLRKHLLTPLSTDYYKATLIMRLDTKPLRRAIHNDKSPQEKSYEVLAVWERTCEEALDIGGDTYRDFYWDLAKDVCKIVIEASIIDSETDWEYITDLLDSYPPDQDQNLVAMPIVHAIGAGVINTYHTTGIDHADPQGFEYLKEGVSNFTDAPWEDARVIGWYYPHEAIDITDEILELSKREPVFVGSTLYHGFMADEEITLEVLDTLLEAQRLDPGPEIIGLDREVFNGGYENHPRYSNYKHKYDITKTPSAETRSEYRDILQKHLKPEFLEHLNNDTTMDLLAD